MKQEQVNKVNILGTEYRIQASCEADNPKMQDAAGLCESYIQTIFIDNNEDNYKEPMAGFDAYCHRVLRHEAFHAIFHEAGCKRYNDDEDLIEMLAILYPKIKTIMETVDNLDISKI